MNNLQKYIDKGYNKIILIKRIPFEIQNYNKLKNTLYKEFGFIIEETFDKTHFKLTIYGPENSPYENGIFEAEISISKSYPFEPLSLEFLTKIFHQNISIQNGKTYLQISSCWKPSYGLIYMAIRTYLLLLRDQFYYFGVLNENAFIMTREKENYGDFLLKVKEYIFKYAKMNNEESEKYKFFIENIKKEREKAKEISKNNNCNYISIKYYNLSVNMYPNTIDVSVNMRIMDVLEEIMGSENKNFFFVIFLGQIIDSRKTVKDACFYNNCHIFIIDEMIGIY